MWIYEYENSRKNCNVLLIALISSFAVLVFALSSTLINKHQSISSSRVVDTLKFAVIVSRHGNRGALFTFPNDMYPPNDTKHWPYGFGELTNVGRVEMYKLGMKIRSLYNGFLNQEFSSKDFHATSTAIDRAVISGQAFLAGLYAPTGFQVWNRDIWWQPIPIYSDSLDKTVIVVSLCPRFMEAMALSVLEFEEENAAELLTVNKYLSEKIGANLTNSLNFTQIWDAFLSQENEGYTLPDWAKSVFPQPMKDLAGKLYVTYFAGQDIMTRIVIGQFYNEMLGLMKSKVNGVLSPDRKLFFYSGHDASLITLQAVLGIPKSSIIGVVHPGSAMIFELHQENHTQQYSVQVLYIDGNSTDLDPVPIHIPRCSTACGFNLFINLTDKFYDYISFEEECSVYKKN